MLELGQLRRGEMGWQHSSLLIPNHSAENWQKHKPTFGFWVCPLLGTSFVSWAIAFLIMSMEGVFGTGSQRLC